MLGCDLSRGSHMPIVRIFSHNPQQKGSEGAIREYTVFELSVGEIKEWVDPCRYIKTMPTKESRERNKKKSRLAFLLCDLGWCLHIIRKVQSRGMAIHTTPVRGFIHFRTFAYSRNRPR